MDDAGPRTGFSATVERTGMNAIVEEVETFDNFLIGCVYIVRRGSV